MLLTHIFIFLFSAAVMWFFAGMLIEAVQRTARRWHTSGFTVAFVVLGLLTSISEFSVAVNSYWNEVPQVSVGNLLGASFVVLFGVIPLLAIAGNGIYMKQNIISNSTLAMILLLVFLPTMLVIDGNVTKAEGVLGVLGYLVIVYFVHKRPRLDTILENVSEQLTSDNKTTWIDAIKILVGAICIFIAGRLLVTEAVFLANWLTVPSSLIGLLLLSLGTNVPEIVVAFQAVRRRQKGVAFGDYLGSVAGNVLIFSLLAVVSGTFSVERSEFVAVSVITAVGLVAFYLFARSKVSISRNEGWALLGFYVLFIMLEFRYLFKFAGD